jgi:hypothetical protein
VCCAPELRRKPTKTSLERRYEHTCGKCTSTIAELGSHVSLNLCEASLERGADVNRLDWRRSCRQATKLFIGHVPSAFLALCPVMSSDFSSHAWHLPRYISPKVFQARVLRAAQLATVMKLRSTVSRLKGHSVVQKQNRMLTSMSSACQSCTSHGDFDVHNRLGRPATRLRLVLHAMRYKQCRLQ